MLWESWVLLILFLAGLVTVITALVADLRATGAYPPRPATLRFELSTGSSYPMLTRPTPGRHRATTPAPRRRR
ncbi:hypothetical protein ACWDOP_33090 [Nocardia sp. NPDC003693]